ncbi:MAG: hypothetical protein CMJ23_10580 [Phycisphaerae bacterium]|nr:hypothetical protein [Phycisphaerae bacterium]
MPRMVANPTPKTRLRGTGVVGGSNRDLRGGGLRSDARLTLAKAASGIRLRGTALKTRTSR